MSSARFARPAFQGSLLALAGGVLLAVAFTTAAMAKTVEELLAEGDQHYAAAQLAEARTSYLAALQEAPGHYATLCRLCRCESELGELQKGDAKRATRSAAVEHARAAVKVAPDSGAAHVWLAVALGRQALSEGAKTRLALSREIKSEVDRGLQLDPNIGRGWHVLGMWNMRIASLNTLERMAANMVGGVPSGASFEQAEKAFQKAIELEPDYVNHRLEFARLLKERGRKEEAREELEKAISLPPTSGALDARYQAEARELLTKIK